MRKKILVALSLLVIIALALAGCKPKAAEPIKIGFQGRAATC